MNVRRTSEAKDSRFSPYLGKKRRGRRKKEEDGVGEEGEKEGEKEEEKKGERKFEEKVGRKRGCEKAEVSAETGRKRKGTRSAW